MSRYTAIDSMSLRPSTMSKRLAGTTTAPTDQLRSCRGGGVTMAASNSKQEGAISHRTRQQVDNNNANTHNDREPRYVRGLRRSHKDQHNNVINYSNNSNSSIDESIKCFNRKLNITGKQQFKDDDEIDSDFSSLSCDERSIDSDKKDETSPCRLKFDSTMVQSSSSRKLQESCLDLKKAPNKSSPMDFETRTTKRIKGSYRSSTESQEREELVCSCGAGTQSHKSDSRLANSEKAELEPNVFYNNNNNNSPRKLLVQPHKLVNLGERQHGQGICNKHMPWFGIDVGGSLVKVVFFDPKDATREETVTLKRIRRYLKSSKAYGTTGKRDAHLEMPNCVINKRTGSLHFIRFATNQMPQFLAMAKTKGFADTINTVCATGGGANMFEDDIKTNLGITLHKTDELDSIIHGINYIDKHNSLRECYFLEDPLNDEKCVKVPYDFSRPYPYLVVNIGSGVSILAVYSSRSYSRISGSSIGGGTFLGLCSLLTQCKTFDEAIKLAKAGSSFKIDKLVKDIYGGDYLKFNLSGDTVASSFGHMNIEEKRKNVKREDLARALLEMVTINIGSIARMCAANANIDRVVFIGNFLRVNQLSMKLLSYAVNYWSKGAIKALFLEHEGYFGAVGCFVESTQGCNLD